MCRCRYHQHRYNDIFGFGIREKSKHDNNAKHTPRYTVILSHCSLSAFVIRYCFSLKQLNQFKIKILHARVNN